MPETEGEAQAETTEAQVIFFLLLVLFKTFLIQFYSSTFCARRSL